MRLIQQTISPVDGRVLVERPLTGPAGLDRALVRASRAYEGWRRTTLTERIAACTALIDAVAAHGDVLADELTAQMGRPRRYTPGEIRGFAERGYSMIAQATEALAPVVPPPKDGFTRYITREPLGVVLVLAPWNYPWLCAVNAVVPALLAGNTVLIKHSDQTPLVAERLSEAGRRAGLPEGVLEHIHMTHELTARAVADPRVAFVAFTGSVGGGRAVHRAAAGHFKAVGLELGGKDPAYVRPDADLAFAVENLVDGAFFNSGQSCCGVERIYVHGDLYDDFVTSYAETVRGYVLGDPTEGATTLGPVVRVESAEAIQAQVAAAVAGGARPLIDARAFPAASDRGAPYLAPQVLVDVDHSMAVMKEETFGPVVGIQRVASDAEALRLMNDSHYGLTASIWSRDQEAAVVLGQQVETGTLFLNRCDALDPELAWVGVKDSGRGCTLSRMGFEHLTRPKSFHLRHPSS